MTVAAEDRESPIRIFLRARPSRRASRNARIDAENSTIEFFVRREKQTGYVNNQIERHVFGFDGILDVDATQEEVFEKTAREVINGSLDGYNGTLFAYGQTGSGKTFTISGGPARYADRGVIPRAISTVFAAATERSDRAFNVHVSYLEIYNDVVYDLLDPDRDVREIEDLPRVVVREDEDGELVFSNLRICKVENEEDALSLLFLGDTHRAMSETPMNMASSRSHCIFTLHIQSRRGGEDVVRASKLNLVDLAGSERIKKTGIDGTTLTESKYINLSLHYLEQVIVALQEHASGRSHIPYRNSAMTLMLRDSLGGNCRTIMIANISVEQKQLDESISTCRFAQRVAMITNQAVVNEAMDPTVVIERLKREVADLKLEIKQLKGEEEVDTAETIEEKKAGVREQLTEYVNHKREELDLAWSMRLIRYGFEVMKEWIVDARKVQTPCGPASTVQQRKENLEAPLENTVKDQNERHARSAPEKSSLDPRTLAAMKHDRELLREKFAAAKRQGQTLTDSKKKLTELKAFIEKKRLKRSFQQLVDQDRPLSSPDPEEQEALQSLIQEKAVYKEAFHRLRIFKKEIETLQASMELYKRCQQEGSVPQLCDESRSYAGQPEFDSAVMQDAQPRLTGNPTVDRHILQFCQARSQLKEE